MLGLYVSGHPLHGVERVLSSKSDMAIATILEGTVPDGHQITIGGILTGVNRRVNKNGEPWASAQLEDLAGGIEVLFFPRCYQVVGVDVAEDAIVLIKARVNRRDDRVSLIVNDLAVPDLSAGGPGAPGAPVRVSMRTELCTPQRVSRLKEVLSPPPGNVRGASGAGQRHPNDAAAPRRRAQGHALAVADGGPEGAAGAGLPGLSADRARRRPVIR